MSDIRTVTAALKLRTQILAREGLPLVLRKVFSDDEVGDLLDVLFGSSETTADQLAQQPYLTLVDALVKARELTP
jgi:hypothetical protein